MSSESDPHGVAHTARGLRHIRDVDLPAEAESVDQEIRDGIEPAARMVDDAAVGELRNEMQRIAHGIRLLGTEMTGAREHATDTTAHVLSSVAAELDVLLRPTDDGHESGPSPLTTATPPPPTPANSSSPGCNGCSTPPSPTPGKPTRTAASRRSAGTANPTWWKQPPGTTPHPKPSPNP